MTNRRQPPDKMSPMEAAVITLAAVVLAAFVSHVAGGVG